MVGRGETPSHGKANHETNLTALRRKCVEQSIMLKGGESSSQFLWFTIAKIELKFLIFFVLILGLRLQRYSTSTKRYPPEKSF